MWKTCLERRNNKNPRRIEDYKTLGNDLDDGADVSPVVDDFCISLGHVDAAMTHGSTKVIVPVRAVYAVVSIEVHGKWDVW